MKFQASLFIIAVTGMMASQVFAYESGEVKAETNVGKGGVVNVAAGTGSAASFDTRSRKRGVLNAAIGKGSK